MKKIIIYLLLISSFSHAKDIESDAKNLYKRILCVVCSGQSIADSDVELAKSMRIYIKKQLEEGYTEKQIENQLINIYGDQISTQPPFNLSTSFLWLSPLLMLILGVFFISKNIISKLVKFKT